MAGAGCVSGALRITAGWLPWARASGNRTRESWSGGMLRSGTRGRIPSGRTPAMAQPTIIAALDAYDAWLGRQCPVIPAELADKRRQMAKSSFSLLRGCCFRFAAQLAAQLPDLANRALVPSCGDAHLENFGTW